MERRHLAVIPAEISRKFRNETTQSSKGIALKNFSLPEAKACTGRDAGDSEGNTAKRHELVARA